MTLRVTPGYSLSRLVGAQCALKQRPFTLTTECDVLDTPETLDQAVSKAAVLWRVSQTEVD